MVSPVDSLYRPPRKISSWKLQCNMHDETIADHNWWAPPIENKKRRCDYPTKSAGMHGARSRN